MPTIDMPLAELERYEGRNPRPEDFDAFWDSSLAEMRAIDPQVELTPHEFRQNIADCFHLRFTGTGGSRVYAKLLRPKNVQGRLPAVLHFHGYSASSGDWNGYLSYVANGMVVAALDCRGQGGQSDDTVATKGPTLNGHIIRGLDDDREKMYYRNVFLDTAQLANIVMEMPEVDPQRVGCTGGSQGGGLTLACAALEPRIKRAAPWFPFLSDYQRVWEMDLDVAAYDELRKFFRSFDPRHEREAEIFTKLGTIDVQHLAPRIQAEVLMGLGLMDTITPPSTCFAAYNKIKSKKRTVVYPDFGHEGLPGFGDTVFEFLSGL
jgi:cephalosporin-C deacetylase